MFCEGILCIKNGRELFSQTHTAKVVSWLLIQAALSILFVSGCVLWHRYIQVNARRSPQSHKFHLKFIPAERREGGENTAEAKSELNSIRRVLCNSIFESFLSILSIAICFVDLRGRQLLVYDAILTDEVRRITILPKSNFQFIFHLFSHSLVKYSS
jgi:hypothetical protein